MRKVAFIPARSGSKRFPNKNVSKLDCGATSNGMTNNPNDYTTIKVLGVRFQTKW